MNYTYTASGGVLSSGVAIFIVGYIYIPINLTILFDSAVTSFVITINPVLEYITGVILTASALTNITGMLSFTGQDARGNFYYDPRLNYLAGLVLGLQPSDNPSYDYTTLSSLNVRNSWVTNVQIQVFWNKVSQNTPVQVSADNVNWINSYFDLYDPRDPNQEYYYVWNGGRTSYSHLNTSQVEEVTCVAALTLNSTYFTIYNGTQHSYYVWFNVNNNGIDPGLVGGPFFNTNFMGIPVLLLSSDQATDVALKLKVTMASTTGFSATLIPNDPTTVAIASTYVARTYAPSPSNSGLKISVVTEGNDEIGYKYAKLA